MQDNKVNSTRIKIFVFVAVFLVGVNLLISATFHNMSQSFYTYEGEFNYHEVREKGIIFLDDLSRELVVNVKDDTSNKVSFSQEFDMSYQDRKIQVISSNFQEEGFVVIYGENEVYTEEIIVLGEELERTHGDIYDLPSDVQLAYGVNKVMTYLDNAILSFRKFLLVAALSLLGSFLITLPNIAVKIETLFLVQDSRTMENLIGVNVLIGLLLIVASLFLNIVLFL